MKDQLSLAFQQMISHRETTCSMLWKKQVELVIILLIFITLPIETITKPYHMNSPLNFMSKAQGLTRNPLGIIALFISMIYGFACIVLSTSMNNLKTSCERLPLIWFIVLFPIIILICFTYLVVKHHKKLYGPGDYKDESYFLSSFIGSVEEVKNKLDHIAFTSLWRLNHWGSNCSKIENNEMIFEGPTPGLDSDGSHIDLINFLEIGKSYEISCFAKSVPSTTALFQLWCHDNSGMQNIVNESTSYKIPTENGEIVKLGFTASYNRNIRIHLQYKPGDGKIIVNDVTIKPIEFFGSGK